MNANQTAIAIQAETAWGVEPGSIALVRQRFTKSDLKHRKITDISKEIRDDAQIIDLIELGVDAGGGFDYELHYAGIMMQLFAGAIRGNQVVTSISAAECDIDASDDSITGLVADGLDDIIVGSWIKISGAATSANNGVKRLVGSTVTGPNVTLEFQGNAFTTDEANVDLDFNGRHVRNGVEEKSFLIEKQLSSDKFMKYPGSMIQTMSMDLVSRQIATGTLGFLGQAGYYDTASVDGSGYTAAAVTKVMNASHNVGSITEGGSAISTALKSLKILMTPNLRPNDGLGTKGLTSIGSGTVAPTGSVEAYFENADLLQKFIDHQYSSLSWRVQNTDGLFIFELPYVQFSTGDIDVAGINTELMQTVEWQAIRHPSDGYTMQIDAIPNPLS